MLWHSDFLLESNSMKAPEFCLLLPFLYFAFVQWSKRTPDYRYFTKYHPEQTKLLVKYKDNRKLVFYHDIDFNKQTAQKYNCCAVLLSIIPICSSLKFKNQMTAQINPIMF